MTSRWGAAWKGVFPWGKGSWETRPPLDAPPPANRVRVITDSTAYLPEDVRRRHRIVTVPLDVVIDGTAYREGVDITPGEVAAALTKRRQVSTSRPSPARLLSVIEELADQGATEVVCVHLSAKLSGTCDAARLAARDAPIPVHVVDSGFLGMALGFCAVSAARASRGGFNGERVAARAVEQAGHTKAFFYVDTLEFLRRGGRIGPAQAIVGSALAVKPLLTVVEGEVQPLEKVRTASRALARLEELAVASIPGAATGEVPVHVAVHHLDSPKRAAEIAERLRARLPSLRALVVSEVGAVIGAHVGPGMTGVALTPVLPELTRGK